MKCQHCDEEFSSNDHFCTNDGAAIPPSAEVDATPPTAQPTKAPKRKKPLIIIAIVLGVILGLFILAIVLLAIIVNMANKKDVELLTQYAESKEWLNDCAIDKTSLDNSTGDDRVQYYIYDFSNDGVLDLAITTVDWGKNAQCLVYYLSGDQVNLWSTFSYYDDDPGESIASVNLAARDDYSGLAMHFTLQAEEERTYIGFLKLSADKGLEEEDSISGTWECEARLKAENWQLLSGTPITVFDATMTKNVALEDLAALTALYAPEDMISGGTFKSIGEKVYGLETTGLYQFSDGQKSTLCSAPANTYYSMYGGLIYCDNSFYILGQMTQAQDKAVIRIDAETGTETVLIELANAEKILKVDGQYIYVQTSHADKEQFGSIVAYDYQGNAVTTFTAPWEWETNGTMAMAADWKGNVSVVTSEGKYVLDNVPTQDATLTEYGAYYLVTENEETKLFFVDKKGHSQKVGAIPACFDACFEQRTGTLYVVVRDESGNETLYQTSDMQCVYSGPPLKNYVPDSEMYSMVSAEYDAATGEVYLVTGYAPHGNCGPIYRLKQGGHLERIRDATEDELYFGMIYDNVLYYYYKDYSAGLDYFSTPLVTACRPID